MGCQLPLQRLTKLSHSPDYGKYKYVAMQPHQSEVTTLDAYGFVVSLKNGI